MQRDGFERWLDAYFAAWISNESDDVAALFAEDAIYSTGPFAEAWSGREEIVRRWTSGTQEDVAYAYEILAVEGDTGIAHWNVTARAEDEMSRAEWDGILLITFAADGRCREHREWLVRREVPAG